jgi:hypothetical protein
MALVGSSRALQCTLDSCSANVPRRRRSFRRLRVTSPAAVTVVVVLRHMDTIFEASVYWAVEVGVRGFGKVHVCRHGSDFVGGSIVCLLDISALAR